MMQKASDNHQQQPIAKPASDKLVAKYNFGFVQSSLSVKNNQYTDYVKPLRSKSKHHFDPKSLIVVNTKPDESQTRNSTLSNSFNVFSYFPKIEQNYVDVLKPPADQCLFDSKIFKSLNIAELQGNYEKLSLKKNTNQEYVFDLGNNLYLRPLRIGDFDLGYTKLLEQLTIVGNDVTREKFETKFRQMKSCSQNYYTVVIADRLKSKIVGNATLVNEHKFIRHATSRGRIEDIVVDDSYRSKGLGKLLLDFVMLLAKHLGCYKISLECEENLQAFYGKFGLVTEECQMNLCKRFDMTKKEEKLAKKT
jgi:glucosamine-phosphate N-acetyltransferase